MLIDRHHRVWCAATVGVAIVATVVYLWFDASTPGGLSGGTLVGLLYGVAGSILMLLVGFLSFLRRIPKCSWIGTRAFWMKAHIWLGLLGPWLILCHGNFRWGGPLERALLIVLLVVVVSGVFGLALQQFMPRLLRDRVASEVPYNQLPSRCQALRVEAERSIEKGEAELKKVGASSPAGASFSTILDFGRNDVLPFLSRRYDRSSALADPSKAGTRFYRLGRLDFEETSRTHAEELLDALEKCCEKRRDLAEQEYFHRWLHGWLLVHVPLSLALLILAVAHVATALYY